MFFRHAPNLNEIRFRLFPDANHPKVEGRMSLLLDMKESKNGTSVKGFLTDDFIEMSIFQRQLPFWFMKNDVRGLRVLFTWEYLVKTSPSPFHSAIIQEQPSTTTHPEIILIHSDPPLGQGREASDSYGRRNTTVISTTPEGEEEILFDGNEDDHVPRNEEKERDVMDQSASFADFSPPSGAMMQSSPRLHSQPAEDMLNTPDPMDILNEILAEVDENAGEKQTHNPSVDSNLGDIDLPDLKDFDPNIFLLREETSPPPTLDELMKSADVSSELLFPENFIEGSGDKTANDDDTSQMEITNKKKDDTKEMDQAAKASGRSSTSSAAVSEREDKKPEHEEEKKAKDKTLDLFGSDISSSSTSDIDTSGSTVCNDEPANNAIISTTTTSNTSGSTSSTTSSSGCISGRGSGSSTDSRSTISRSSSSTSSSSSSSSTNGAKTMVEESLVPEKKSIPGNSLSSPQATTDHEKKDVRQGEKKKTTDDNACSKKDDHHPYSYLAAARAKPKKLIRSIIKDINESRRDKDGKKKAKETSAFNTQPSKTTPKPGGGYSRSLSTGSSSSSAGDNGGTNSISSTTTSRGGGSGCRASSSITSGGGKGEGGSAERAARRDSTVNSASSGRGEGRRESGYIARAGSERRSGYDGITGVSSSSSSSSNNNKTDGRHDRRTRKPLAGGGKISTLNRFCEKRSGSYDFQRGAGRSSGGSVRADDEKKSHEKKMTTTIKKMRMEREEDSSRKKRTRY